MVRIENHCCDCATAAYPCRGKFCPLRRVEVHYCDNCGAELEEHEWDDYGKELCEVCLEKIDGGDES